MGRITAQTVFSSPRARRVITLGAMVTWKGSTISTSTRKNSASRPRNWKRLRA